MIPHHEYPSNISKTSFILSDKIIKSPEHTHSFFLQKQMHEMEAALSRAISGHWLQICKSIISSVGRSCEDGHLDVRLEAGVVEAVTWMDSQTEEGCPRLLTAGAAGERSTNYDRPGWGCIASNQMSDGGPNCLISLLEISDLLEVPVGAPHCWNSLALVGTHGE